MRNPLKAIAGLFNPKVEAVPTVEVMDLDPFNPDAYQYQSPSQHQFYDGDKFPGSFGVTDIFQADYWTLRRRSDQLFTENLYARGLLRRLITNIINTGLVPETAPEETILGFDEGDLDEWSEDTENIFNIWAKNSKLCDYHEQKTFGQLQKAAKLEALITGDCLVVLRFDRRTNLPRIQLISGNAVETPLGVEVAQGHTIEHGVEKDSQGRVVAHHVRQEDFTSRRIPAYGPRSRRRLSWLVYGTEKRLNDTRGEPLLSLVVSSLKEVDRYRDAVQRKAAVNALYVMFIKKGEDKMGTTPITNGAIRRDAVQVSDTDGTKRTLNVAKQIPGVFIDELQHGEEPVQMTSQGIDLAFGPFEEAIIQAIAWANEIPPEILRLAFSNNYSASQAAINEFKMFLNKERQDYGDDFCQPIYIEWFISNTLVGKIDAPGFLQAWRDLTQYDIFGAWIACDWSGMIKPSTDIKKQAEGYRILIGEGLSTRDRASKELTGKKFSKIVKTLRRENEQLARVLEPLTAVENTQETPQDGSDDDAVDDE